MKRYLLFGFDRYYPSGGLNDVIISFDNVTEINWDAIEYDLGYQNYQILDMDKRHKTGINIDNEIEKYEEEFGELDWDKSDEFRVKILKEFIVNSVK